MVIVKGKLVNVYKSKKGNIVAQVLVSNGNGNNRIINVIMLTDVSKMVGSEVEIPVAVPRSFLFEAR